MTAIVGCVIAVATIAVALGNAVLWDLDLAATVVPHAVMVVLDLAHPIDAGNIY